MYVFVLLKESIQYTFLDFHESGKYIPSIFQKVQYWDSRQFKKLYLQHLLRRSLNSNLFKIHNEITLPLNKDAMYIAASYGRMYTLAAR